MNDQIPRDRLPRAQEGPLGIGRGAVAEFQSSIPCECSDPPCATHGMTQAGLRLKGTIRPPGADVDEVIEVTPRRIETPHKRVDFPGAAQAEDPDDDDPCDWDDDESDRW